MKKNLNIMYFLIFYIALLLTPINEGIVSSVVEAASSQTPPVQESVSASTDTVDIGLSAPAQSSISQNLSTSNQSNNSPNDNPGTGAEDNVLNQLPEETTPEELDTLGKIINWWTENPVGMKLWYLFLIISMIMFFSGLTSFRKSLLFVSIVIFGFYLGNTVNPINSIFSIPVEKGAKLINSLILVVIPIILSLFFGRFFCGWVCPVGAVQELIHPEKFKFRMSSILDRIFSYFRYILLLVGILFTWLEISNIWDIYDPFQCLFNFKWPLTATILLSIILTGSIFIERFFCRYLCPLGGILALTSKFSLVKMRPDSDACIACGKCSQPKACPMDMISADNPYIEVPTIEASECILCNQCVDICHYSAIKLSSRLNVNPNTEKATGDDLTT